MRRKKTGAERDNDSAKLDISSLIDVSFLLLVFFLAAMTLEKAEAELKMVLPGEGPGEPMLLPMLEVKVQPSGVILVNEEALEMDEGSRRLPRLYERLEEYKRLAKMSQAEPLVLVAADDEARGQRLVDVLNCLAEAEIEEVTLSGFREAE
jgi:biopolymer transport protein ExbD